nr:acyl carrier protein 1, chloroplastic [Ipomoea batatas]
MAAISATCFRLQTSVKQPSKTIQIEGRSTARLNLACVAKTRTGFPSLRTTGRFHVCCVAKTETVQKVCDIVRKQLALPAETDVTPQTKFAELGADSLDTVEIVMCIEEEFGISVEEQNAESITSVQEAAELIDKLVNKPEA